jgi:hypothetical protein
MAAFGPSGGKKMHVLQSVFWQIPRNHIMAWNLPPKKISLENLP